MIETAESAGFDGFTPEDVKSDVLFTTVCER